MSTEHEVRVVRLGDIVKHDNADSLGITEVDGRPCVVRLGEWAPGDLAVYVPIDSLCPVSDPRFAFLGDRSKQNAAGQCRIRAARLRGVFSMGLLVRPDADMAEGDEVRERMGIDIWEPGESFGAPPDSEPDPGFLPVYDIESVRKWSRLLAPGEEVILTEKIHGANGRFAFHQGRLWCASRGRFPAPGGSDPWWKVAEVYGLEERLAKVPGVAIYGEVYGPIQDLKYGGATTRLVLFDALDIESRRWLDYDAFLALATDLGLPTVPEIYRGPWSPDLFTMAEGKTILGHGAHVREGWVLKVPVERFDIRLGRVILKLHGQDYLTRKGG